MGVSKRGATGLQKIQHSILEDFATWATTPDACSHTEGMAQARLAILDTTGCMIAGGREPQINKIARVLLQTGAAGGVRTVAVGESFSLSGAALINGTAIHIQDFDDYETPASTHPSAPIIGALAAIAEHRSISLGEFLEAYIAGYEAIVRIGQALGGYAHYMAGWHATSTVGPFGAAAAIAKVLHLNTSQFTNALALVASSSAGLKAQFGTDAKAIHGGLAARAGLEAALLAEAGLTASPGVMDGKYGFLARYGGGEPLPATPMQAQMMAITQYPVLRKPWPCCAYTHRSIEAALKIRAKPDFSAVHVETGIVQMPEPYFRVVSVQNPESPAQARFCVTWCVAAALADGVVTPDHFTEDALARDDLRSLHGRLHVDAYDTQPGLTDLSADAPDTVTVNLSDGSALLETIATVKGGERKPLSEADIHAKFRACGGTDELAKHIMSGSVDQPFRFRA